MVAVRSQLRPLATGSDRICRDRALLCGSAALTHEPWRVEGPHQARIEVHCVRRHRVAPVAGGTASGYSSAWCAFASSPDDAGALPSRPPLATLGVPLAIKTGWSCSPGPQAR